MSQITSEPTTEPEVLGSSDVAPAVEGRSPRQIFWIRFRRDRVALVGIAFIILLVLGAIFAGVFADHIAHHGVNEINDNLTNEFSIPNVGPSAAFYGGVDKLGRDVFVRTLYGARTSLEVTLLATLLSVIVGVVLGLFAGFFGGKIDTLISRAVDIVLSLPVLLLAIGISAACSTSVTGCLGGLIQPGAALVIAIIALFGWPYMTRIVRGQTLSYREREFVEAARATGYGSGHVMFREILPNLVAPIIVYGTLLIPQNIIFEASLSYLGVGIPPGTPSWGRMIFDATDGQLYLLAWWTLLLPGMALVLTTLSFNLVGDGLRDALDPRTTR